MCQAMNEWTTQTLRNYLIELGVKRWDVREWQEFKVRGLFTWHYVLFSSILNGIKRNPARKTLMSWVFYKSQFEPFFPQESDFKYHDWREEIARRAYLYGRIATIFHTSVYTLEISLLCIILFALHNNAVLCSQFLCKFKWWVKMR